MLTFVVVLHVVVSLFLIGVVLLQPGNKGGVGAALGGAGGSTVFGGRGANTFLAKLTSAAAVLFMVTNFSLVYFSSKSGSVFDNAPAATAKKDGDKAGEGAKSEGAADKAEAPAADDKADAPAADAKPAAPADAKAPEGDAAK